MTEEELNRWVQAISLKKFHRPFRHRAIFNPRLKTTGGRYHLKDHHLDFNPKMLRFGLETFEGIICHELCHYHLHLMGLPYKHRDKEFKELLKKVKGLRYAPRLFDNQTSKSVTLHYRCQNCQQDYFRKRRMDTKKYVCGKCRGPLKLCQNIE